MNRNCVCIFEMNERQNYYRSCFSSFLISSFFFFFTPNDELARLLRDRREAKENYAAGRNK